MEDRLPYLVFLENKNTNVQLQLDNIESTKELFGFCLDMFCKGLALLGSDSHEDLRVEVNNLPQEVIDDVVRKLKLVGIKTNIMSYHESYYSIEGVDVVQSSLRPIRSSPKSDKLENYIFGIKVGEYIHHISFEAIRV